MLGNLDIGEVSEAPRHVVRVEADCLVHRISRYSHFVDSLPAVRLKLSRTKPKGWVDSCLEDVVTRVDT